ncbi:PQQ-binding-like beta-propeller repeat protein [Anaeromicrobium sediminis]|uniref:Uncharacterized protein n=1 Tax=Anaeromicrobium sediminis TaxID=1478221 RepID=A0A267MQ64_9FIRM|nr:PQQ-binding-like beta-propeller repeat protein [Anaeromicrobium sediminis]PAB61045.1 hypothetical protein CCE28_01035 [Anaeromicrobium sediminis]
MKSALKNFLFIVVCILVISTVAYVNTNNSKDRNIKKAQEQKFELPKQNIVDLDVLWTFKIDGEPERYITEGDKLYILSSTKTIYTVSLSELRIIDEFKIDVDIDDDGFSYIAIEKGVIALAYGWDSDDIFIINTKTKRTKRVVFNRKFKDRGDASRFLIYNNILMYDGSIYVTGNNATFGMDYTTGKVVWKNDRGFKAGSVDLYKYKNKYLYLKGSTYYEFNPKTGEVLNKYPFIRKSKDEKNFLVDNVFKNPPDEEFGSWHLRNIATSKGYFYTLDNSKFNFYERQLHPIWVIDFEKRISERQEYGRYMVLSLCNNYEFKGTKLNDKLIKDIVLLDLENTDRPIIWNTGIHSELWMESIIVVNNQLYTCDKYGTVKVFDLSKLEK